MSPRVRSIASGWSPPTPPWKGSSRKLRSSSIAAMTATTLPMNSAGTHARSPLSAMPNRNTRMIAAMKNSTIQSGTGMIPSAPWIRSWRAASRASVWSSHFA